MKNENINIINELLIDNSDALTDFYDEALKYGRNQGMLYGTIITLVGVLSFHVFKKHQVNNKKSKEEA